MKHFNPTLLWSSGCILASSLFLISLVCTQIDVGEQTQDIEQLIVWSN
ncbi:MAG: hypothetical protein HAW67_02555 [Endozoicomonadaceae bacterium]|nr:hypothetical protein [Endozoicomonadaceae bacterium]